MIRPIRAGIVNLVLSRFGLNHTLVLKSTESVIKESIP